MISVQTIIMSCALTDTKIKYGHENLFLFFFSWYGWMGFQAMYM